MELKILITISAEFLNFLNAQRFPLRRLEVNFNASMILLRSLDIDPGL